jgi:hypothetical protein
MLVAEVRQQQVSVMAGLVPAIHVFVIARYSVWLRQPEHKLDDPGNPVTPASAYYEVSRLLDSRFRRNDKINSWMPGTSAWHDGKLMRSSKGWQSGR